MKSNRYRLDTLNKYVKDATEAKRKVAMRYGHGKKRNSKLAEVPVTMDCKKNAKKN